MTLVFEWDHHKARRNPEKHRAGFVEAVSVSNDPLGADFRGRGSPYRRVVRDRHCERRNAFASSGPGPPREESNTIMKKTSQG